MFRLFRHLFPELPPPWLWTCLWLTECAVLTLAVCWQDGPSTACAFASLLGGLGALVYLYALARRKNLGWTAVLYGAIPLSVAMAAFAPAPVLGRPWTAIVAMVIVVGNATIAYSFVRSLPEEWSILVWMGETPSATTVTRNVRENHDSSLPPL